MTIVPENIHGGEAAAKTQPDGLKVSAPERWRLAGWPGGVSPPVWQATKHSLVSLSGETPPSQPARRQRSDRREAAR
jgi:hypothetical protein